MIPFLDIRFWLILLGLLFAVMVAAIAFQAITGRDLDPPEDG